MACLNTLKQEIRSVERVFHKTHERFQVVSASVDELSCRFICKGGKKHDITANITETYPHMPPVWFADSEDCSITGAVERLSSTTGLDNHVINQVGILVRSLCKVQGLPEPTPELEKLSLALDMGSGDAKLGSPSNSTSNASGSASASTNGNGSSDAEMDIDYDFDEDCDDDDDDEDNNEEEDEEEDLHLELEDETANKNKEKEGLDSEHLATLERLKANQRQDYLQGTVTGSVQASDRLMKELRDIYRSDTFKKGIYSIDLINDSLYEWKIKLKGVDKDSPLYADLMTLKEREGKDFIELNMLFKENYPFEPPFVRVVHPLMSGGYVLLGGAICMELLTKQGWSSAYTIEAVIMQIAATFVKGKARIQFGGNKVSASSGQYSLARAQQSYKSLVQIHEKNGWYTPPKADG
ncbi:Ubiquitin-conjugating enzyme E2 Q2 [Orchesella cincta]|uniref:Ubiquitin-conjugating enzyme E2 Q2 n=1 Tax=Orchesella cincta TaxID=48709 RepID=A0A1D2MY60_ORCCI|nr:Ubiquitin-conjugating enzyme E2 Q2 [Orchesella cincta]